MKIFNFTYIIFFSYIAHITAQPQTSEIDVINLHKSLRCLVCEGQSIYDSEAEFSKNIKSQTAKMVKEGVNIQEIENFYIKTYGTEILLTPQFNKNNILIWLFPYILIICFSFFFFKK